MANLPPGTTAQVVTAWAGAGYESWPLGLVVTPRSAHDKTESPHDFFGNHSHATSQAASSCSIILPLQELITLILAPAVRKFDTPFNEVLRQPALTGTALPVQRAGRSRQGLIGRKHFRDKRGRPLRRIDGDIESIQT